MKKPEAGHEIRRLLHINHHIDDLVIGDFVCLNRNYGESDEFFTIGKEYEVINIDRYPNDPSLNAIAVKADNGESYVLPYTNFNVDLIASNKNLN